MTEAGWQTTLLYVAIFSGVIGFMKVASALRSPGSFRPRCRFVLLSPVYSTETWSRVQPASWTAFRPMLEKSAWVFPCLIVVYAALVTWVGPAVESWTVRAYLAIVPMYLLVEAMGLIGQSVGIPFGWLMPRLLEDPIRSKGLLEFWGRRWNRWMTDWLNELCYRPFLRRPWIGLFAAFFVSGLIHEVIVNLPFFVVYRRSLFGTMLAYFLIQVVGIVVERKWLRRRARLRRILLWVVVIGPAPLVMNEGTLRIFHFFG